MMRNDDTGAEMTVILSSEITNFVSARTNSYIWGPPYETMLNSYQEIYLLVSSIDLLYINTARNYNPGVVTVMLPFDPITLTCAGTSYTASP